MAGSAATEIRIQTASQPSGAWDRYVAAAANATVYHTSAWIALASDLFGYRTYYLHAWRNSELVGVLPLVHQKTFPLANRLVSLPYCNYGSALGADDAVGALLNEAAALGTSLGCPVELRDKRERLVNWECEMGKVSFLLDLPDSMPELSARFGSKLRSQIRRAEREPAHVAIGGAELVDDFYAVFAENMRDLGTPVYPRRFFRAVMDTLGAAASIVAVRRDERPVAACLLIRHGRSIEIPWAACTKDAKARSTNMLLYAQALAYAIRCGASVFDFGRCTVDTGTFRFKQQWGAVPSALYWYRWPASGRRSGRDSIMDLASTAWRHLPLSAANLLGPYVSPALRW